MKKIFGKQKKAQMKMVETSLVMIVFFFLLILGVVVYSRFQAANYKEEAETQFTKKLISMAQIISFLPEVQCSRDNVIESSCFDLYKIKAFSILSGVGEDSDEDIGLFYFDHFGFANVSVRKIYLGSEPDEMINLYDLQKPEWFTQSAFQTPMLIFDPVEKLYSFGVLEIKLYK